MSTHICPWWVGYLLISPVRKYWQDPYKILGEFITPGMKIVDFGSAMGYFSLPMAKMTGPTGKVYCFDIQNRMLKKLIKRAKKTNVENIIEARQITDSNNVYRDLGQKIDFILLAAVVHEVPDVKKLFTKLFDLLKNEGLLLFAEPGGHVSKINFQKSVSAAKEAGLENIKILNMKRNHAVLLKK